MDDYRENRRAEQVRQLHWFKFKEMGFISFSSPLIDDDEEEEEVCAALATLRFIHMRALCVVAYYAHKIHTPGFRFNAFRHLIGVI